MLSFRALEFHTLSVFYEKNTPDIPPRHIWDARQLTKTTRACFTYAESRLLVLENIGVVTITSQSCPRGRLLRLLHLFI